MEFCFGRRSSRRGRSGIGEVGRTGGGYDGRRLVDFTDGSDDSGFWAKRSGCVQDASGLAAGRLGLKRRKKARGGGRVTRAGQEF